MAKYRVTGFRSPVPNLRVTGTLTAGKLFAGDGSASAPSITFTNDSNTGLYLVTADTLGITSGGALRFTFNNGSTTGLILGSGLPIAWSDAAAPAGTSDLKLYRDAAATLALKNGTNAQVFNHYGSEITAGSRYSRLAIKHATTTLSAVSGATVTATNLIPAKANVMGVNTVVTAALGTGSGTTGYAVGDGSDPNRWGDVTGTAAGTDTDGTDATADPTGYFNAANNVVITAAGGNFDGTGDIFVDVAYWVTEAA